MAGKDCVVGLENEMPHGWGHFQRVVKRNGLNAEAGQFAVLNMPFAQEIFNLFQIAPFDAGKECKPIFHFGRAAFAETALPKWQSLGQLGRIAEDGTKYEERQ